MCVTIYGRFCPDEDIVAVFRVDRKNNIKTAICASLPRWLSSVILLLFTNFVNIHTVDHNIQDLRIGIFHADSSDVSHTLDRILDIFPHDTFSRLEASTADAIFAAQEDFAPSQTIPPTFPMVLTMVRLTSSYDPPER